MKIGKVPMLLIAYVAGAALAILLTIFALVAPESSTVLLRWPVTVLFVALLVDSFVKYVCDIKLTVRTAVLSSAVATGVALVVSATMLIYGLTTPSFDYKAFQLLGAPLLTVWCYSFKASAQVFGEMLDAK